MFRKIRKWLSLFFVGAYNTPQEWIEEQSPIETIERNNKKAVLLINTGKAFKCDYCKGKVEINSRYWIIETGKKGKTHITRCCVHCINSCLSPSM